MTDANIDSYDSVTTLNEKLKKKTKTKMCSTGSQRKKISTANLIF